MSGYYAEGQLGRFGEIADGASLVHGTQTIEHLEKRGAWKKSG